MTVRNRILLTISIGACVFFIFAAIWYYTDRPSHIIPYSYKYVQNGTLYFTNGTQIPVESIWKIAFNFSTNDVFSAGTEVTVNAIARVEDSFPHANATILFPSAFPKVKQYYDGHAGISEMPLAPDPADNHRFTGETTIIWRDAGAKCVVIRDDSTVPQSEVPANCLSHIEPVFVLPPEELKLAYESDKRIGFITFIGVAIAALGIGSYFSYKSPTDSGTTIVTSEGKQDKPKQSNSRGNRRQRQQ
jgi:hypothetical protein